MRRTAAVVAGASFLAAGALIAGGTIADVTPESDVTFVGPGTTELLPGQYVGPCSIVTPPEPDPCQAAQLVLRYQVLGNVVNTTYHPKWVAANPGEMQRLAALMAAPRCSTPTAPQPQTMRTFYGAMLGDVIEAYACALGTEPVTWPAANPPPLAGAKDKTAPSAPGPIVIGP